MSNELKFSWDGDSYRLAGRIEVGRVFLTADHRSYGGVVSGDGSTGTYNKIQHGGAVSAERAARESVESRVRMILAAPVEEKRPGLPTPGTGTNTAPGGMTDLQWAEEKNRQLNSIIDTRIALALHALGCRDDIAPGLGMTLRVETATVTGRM